MEALKKLPRGGTKIHINVVVLIKQRLVLTQ